MSNEAKKEEESNKEGLLVEGQTSRSLLPGEKEITLSDIGARIDGLKDVFTQRFDDLRMELFEKVDDIEDEQEEQRIEIDKLRTNHVMYPTFFASVALVLVFALGALFFYVHPPVKHPYSQENSCITAEK